MDIISNLLIYDRLPLLIPKLQTLKKTRRFEARLEEAAVLPYLVPGVGLAMVLRPVELVTSQSRVDAYRDLVVCDGHPPDGAAHTVGKGLVLNAEVFNDGLNGSIVIHDQALLDKIIEDGITELSPGYMADLVPCTGEFKGVGYTYRHANYAVNGVERLEHQAIVKHGRHGGSTALKIEDGMSHAVALNWDEARSVIDLGRVTVAKNENLRGEDMKTALADTTVETPLTPLVTDAIGDAPEQGEATKPDAKTEAEVDAKVEPEVASAPEEKRKESEEEKKIEAEEVALILEGVKKLLEDYMSRSCPDCEAKKLMDLSSKLPKTESDDSGKIENALNLDEDAIGGVLELARVADGLGVVYENIDLVRDLRSVQNKVAAKLSIVIEDSLTDRELSFLIKGRMSAPQAKSASGIGDAVSAIKAAQARNAAQPKPAPVEHPLAGLA